MDKILIKTKRLIIKSPSVEDYSAFCKGKAERLPSRNTWDPPANKAKSITRVQFKKIVRKNDKAIKNKEEPLFLLIFAKGDLRTVVGGVSLNSLNRDMISSGDIGYSIYNNYWGMGYGKESVAAFIKFLFKRWGFHRIQAEIELGNIRSIRLARAVGMKRVGLNRKYLFLRKKWRDALTYALTCEDYRMKWKPLKKKKK